MLTSYLKIEQYENQEIDIGAIVVHVSDILQNA